MRILVVDDSEDARDILSAALAIGGYEDVDYAESGENALSMLGVEPRNTAGQHFDVILIDVIMPGLNGIETCAKIRSDARYQDTPILMVTSINDSGSLSHAFIAGATDYVTKPFNRTELLARMRSACRLKGEVDRRHAREADTKSAPAGNEQTGPSQTFHPITGLFGPSILETWLRSDAAPMPSCILAVAIRNGKRLRSVHGSKHVEVGMKTISDALGRLPAGLTDFCAHYDDDILIVCLHGTSARQDAALISAIAERVRRLEIQTAESAVETTLSVGIGEARPEGEIPSKHSLVSTAIERMELVRSR
ncbi:response regulator [Notoacmeibacter ruber]|nr:response regulator [Notoacmeibacter ruber]